MKRSVATAVHGLMCSVSRVAHQHGKRPRPPPGRGRAWAAAYRSLAIARNIRQELHTKRLPQLMLFRFGQVVEPADNGVGDIA